jgi:putative CocE/NonD family hydrolase
MIEMTLVKLRRIASCFLIATASAASAQSVTLQLSNATGLAIEEQAKASGGSQLDLLKANDIATGTDLLAVPMRDGVNLSASILIPKNTRPSQKLPVIVIKSPYRDNFDGVPGEVARRALAEGYAIVVVNDRGQQWSQGSYSWLKGANNDNSDMLDWIAAQPWSNGRVGAIGCSSSSEWMLPIGAKGHPALKAIVPIGAATGVGEIPGFDDQGIWYSGGVPQLFWSWWFYMYGYKNHPEMPKTATMQERQRMAAAFTPETLPIVPDGLQDHLPSADILKSTQSPSTIFDDLMTWSPGDARWQEFDFLRTGDKMKVPALHIDSWFDHVEAYPTAKMFEYLSTNSPNQYLIFGPTIHCEQGTETEDTRVGAISVGDARFDYTETVMRFLNHWVKNDGQGRFDDPKVRYYLMHDKWRASSSWPVPEGQEQRLFLGSKGRANSLWGDGILTANPSYFTADYDGFVADPKNPVFSKAASCCDPIASADQRNVEARADVLVYTSEPLKADTDIVGYVNAHLELSADVKDFDATFKFLDVYPDGSAYNLFDTIKRLRYRLGIHHESRLEPGVVYPLDIAHAVTAVRIKAGHRIRIEIAASNFPAYERNLQTGGSNFDETQSKVANIKLHHSADSRSYISFTTLP